MAIKNPPKRVLLVWCLVFMMVSFLQKRFALEENQAVRVVHPHGWRCEMQLGPMLLRIGRVRGTVRVFFPDRMATLDETQAANQENFGPGILHRRRNPFILIESM